MHARVLGLVGTTGAFDPKNLIPAGPAGSPAAPAAAAGRPRRRAAAAADPEAVGNRPAGGGVSAAAAGRPAAEAAAAAGRPAVAAESPQAAAVLDVVRRLSGR